ncbi:MAG: hypothetical protein IJS53_04040 [Clostridia bacterium]|nr:hypothetical protein [Clostridia bacterium]
MQNKSKKKGLKPIYKPYLLGTVFSRKAAGRGWKVGGYLVVLGIISLLVGGLLSSDSLALRLIVSVVMIVSCGMLLYSEGGRQGEQDVAFAEIAQNRLNEGRRVPESEKDACFHPGKGFFTALVGVLPLFLLALAFSLIAQKQFYGVGALPAWVSAYQGEASIGQALSYYAVEISIRAEDVLRLLMRFLLFPFVNIVGTNDVEGLYLVDKLSPLLCLILPLFYAVGYLRGPYLRALVHGNIRLGRRRHDARERKARQVRAQRGAEQKKELI